MKPYIDEGIDQNPRIVQGKTLLFHCPVLGNPEPTVEWKKDNLTVVTDDRITIVNQKDLQITDATVELLQFYYSFRKLTREDILVWLPTMLEFWLQTINRK